MPSEAEESEGRTTRLFVDRVEDRVAVLVAEAGEVVVPREILPGGTREGDWLAATLVRDPATTEAKRDAVARRRSRLADDDDGGDLDL